MATRRRFSREFKFEAVKLVKDRGVSVSQASRDLDLNEGVLGQWVKELVQHEQDAFPGGFGLTDFVPQRLWVALGITAHFCAGGTLACRVRASGLPQARKSPASRSVLHSLRESIAPMPLPRWVSRSRVRRSG